MIPALWFLSGVAATLLVLRLAQRPRPAAVPPAALPAPRRPQPRVMELTDPRPLRELSESVGEELAILASGVEGQSQLLCEALHDPLSAAEHAEQLWETVRRLRFFSEKLQCASSVPPLEMQPTNVGHLLATLVPEIEDYAATSFQVSLNAAPSLPLARANPDALRKAVLFLIENVFELEPDASTLALVAQSQSTADDDLVVRIDIEADIEDGQEIRVKPAPNILFSFIAAKNLLHAQGANIVLRHTPGLNAVASITLEATTEPVAEPRPGPEDEDLSTHQFGGVLVMEANPAIRSMLARELQRTQRNVIVCADGVAATALFNATPERFEALILEQESRRLSGEQFALRALERKADLKIVILTPATGTAVDPVLALNPNLHIIHKPFGLMELREALGQLLGPAPVPSASAGPAR